MIEALSLSSFRDRFPCAGSLSPDALCPFSVVEMSGIEPLTSCLQSRRSPN